MNALASQGVHWRGGGQLGAGVQGGKGVVPYGRKGAWSLGPDPVMQWDMAPAHGGPPGYYFTVGDLLPGEETQAPGLARGPGGRLVGWAVGGPVGGGC